VQFGTGVIVMPNPLVFYASLSEALWFRYKKSG